MGLLKQPKKKKKKPASWGWKRLGSPGAAQQPVQVTKPAPCAAHCPSGNNLRGAMCVVAQRKKLGLSEEAALDEAWRLVTDTNPFPAIMGRICPHPCELHCNRNEKDGAVAIAAFERFLGDWGIAAHLSLTRSDSAHPTGKSIAVVGAGPGGLSCAYQLARRGHAVTVFEAYPRPGGMLRYGVPSHRLSRGVLDAEIGRLLRLGIVLECNCRIGQDTTIDALRSSFDAVFIAIGAHRGRRLEIPGGQGVDVFSGIEFLRRANSEPQLCFGPKVLVVGDGQTAIDVARVANRLGRPRGTAITLLRAQTQSEEDLSELGTEGIEVAYSTTPTEIVRSASGRIAEVRAQPARLSDPDGAGVRLPVPVPGETSAFPADTVIAAVSQYPDWEGLFGGMAQPEVDAWGRTGIDGVWTGGDNIMLDIAARSIGQGLRAALSIDAWLSGRSLADQPRRQPVSTGRVKLDLYEPSPRSSQHRLTPAESLQLPAEIEQGLTREQAVREASRCLGCGTCIGCERCWMYCTPGCFSKVRGPSRGEPYFTVSLAACDACRKCADVCPSGFIEMQ
jgi:NADPH-dependent glutamate synthase beta subunit-like oxidoreductase